MDTLKYEDALRELEEIAQKMEQGACGIDELTEQLKKANKLIKLCRDKLKKADADIQKIISDEAESGDDEAKE